MLTEHERKQAADRVTWVGFFTNLILTSAKLVAGVLGHSGAMIADAVHSLSDFATDIVVLSSFTIVEKPSDNDHDYGHGKFETFATTIISVSLLFVGIGIFYSGAHTIWHTFKGEPLEAPGVIALIAAVVVSLFILKVGWDIAKGSVSELLECALSERDKQEILCQVFGEKSFVSIHVEPEKL